MAGLPPLSRQTGTSDETIRDRLRMLAAVDDSVGLLLDALEESGRLDDTVFIVTSDHGYWYGEHGLSVERRLAYEEGIRVPLLVRYRPKFPPGSVVDQIALSVDLAPTLIALAGAKPEQQMDGRSSLPLLAGESAADWRSSFLIEYNTDTVFPRVLDMGYKALRTRRWKYIRYNELDDMDEMYDLQNDPYEMRNLIREPAHQATLKRLQTELERMLKPTP
jgi:N-acetylglucosamine-6-sulfatase